MKHSMMRGVLTAFALAIVLVAAVPSAHAQGELFILSPGVLPNGVLRYDATTGTPYGEFRVGGPVVTNELVGGLAFGPDGNLYVSYYDGIIARFDGSTGFYLGNLVDWPGAFAGYDPTAMAFGPDGILYVAARFNVFRFNAVTGAPLGALPVTPWNPYVSDLLFGGDGMLYICSNFGTILRYNPNTQAVSYFSSAPSGAERIAFGPDGDLYITGYDGAIGRVDGATGLDLGFQTGSSFFLNNALAFSPTTMYANGGGGGGEYGTLKFDAYTGEFLGALIQLDPPEVLGTQLLFNSGRSNAGTNVSVSPTQSVTLTFSTIATTGQTTVTPLVDQNTPLPENFQAPAASGGFLTFFNIDTTAEITGPVTLGFAYDGTVFKSVEHPELPEPVIMHFEGGAWVNITTGFDDVNHKVYGVTNTFSPFAIVKRLAYSWSGVLQPINSDGSSVFKRGSTIPVKFKLLGVDAGISNLNAKLYLSQSSSVNPVSTNEAVSNGSGDSGNTFRYDPSTQQYIFNLSTKDLAQGTWWLRIDLGDGQDHIVQVGLKK